MFLILVLFMLFASTFTIGKAVLVYTTPIFFIGIRMLIGGGLLLAYQLIKHKNIHIELRDIGLMAQISFFHFYAAFILEFWALQYVSSSKTCLIFNLAPFITAIISFFLLGEYLSRKKLLGLAIGFVGFLPVMQESQPVEDFAGSLLWLSLPEWALLGSVFCASYAWLVVKQAQNRGYSIVLINGVSMMAAGIAALITSLAVEGIPHIMPPINCYSKSLPLLCRVLGDYGAGIAIFLMYLFALVVVANIVAFNLYGYLLTFYTATFLAFASFITPVFTAFFGWWYLGETVGLAFWLSMAVVSIGLLIFYSEELKNI